MWCFLIIYHNRRFIIYINSTYIHKIDVINWINCNLVIKLRVHLNIENKIKNKKKSGEFVSIARTIIFGSSLRLFEQNVRKRGFEWLSSCLKNMKFFFRVFFIFQFCYPNQNDIKKTFSYKIPSKPNPGNWFSILGPDQISLFNLWISNTKPESLKKNSMPILFSWKIYK